jgi:AraC-like DNA-binding protein
MKSVRPNNKKIVQLSLYDDFDIKVSSFNGTFPSYKHFLFELVFVLNGSGDCVVNSERFEYSADDLFILTPDADHQFEVKEETNVCIISFNEAFFSPNKSYTNRGIDFNEIFKKLEVIYYSLNLLQPRVTFADEKQLVKNIVHQLIEENEKKQMFHYALMQNLMFLLLALTARRLQSDSIDASVADPGARLTLDVISYIQYHIYDKKKLSLSHLEKTFGRSKDSLLRYFRSATGKTIKEFVMEYKLSLVRSRLLFSDMPVSEIADELDFTDESHLNKMFKARLKNYTGQVPGTVQ